MPPKIMKTVWTLLGCLPLLGLWGHAGTAAESLLPTTDASPSAEGRYIVRLRSDVAAVAGMSATIAAAHGVAVGQRYDKVFQGFAGRMSADAAQALRRHPLVAAVEPDVVVALGGVTVTQDALQTDAPWGLDRIDQRALPLDDGYHYPRTGAGVTAFVVDTGMFATHTEFEGRVGTGHSVIDDGRGSADCHGHGTHVAGTIGGRRSGVAKGVRLVPVRVLDCSGSGLLSGVIGGLDWVANQATTPSVVNLSLSTARSEVFNAAVAAVVARGITVVVAAGNDNTDACTRSPASEPKALTVAASTASDARAVYSNHGACVRLYAPGDGVTSAWHTSAEATATLSGTSMAAPHVSGVAALALSANATATPADVMRFIIDNATPQAVDQGTLGAAGPLVYASASGAPRPWSVAVGALSAVEAQLLPDGRQRARVRVTVLSHDGKAWAGAVAGARVSGVFVPGGPAACTTDAAGQCLLSRCATDPGAQPENFTVRAISADGLLEDLSLGVAATEAVVPAAAAGPARRPPGSAARARAVTPARQGDPAAPAV